MTAFRPIDWIEWLPGDRYMVGDDGSMWGRRRGTGRWKRLKCMRSTKDQLRIRLTHRGRSITVSVAALVLRAFRGPRPLGCEAKHWPDPDPRNNSLANLRWAPKNSFRIGDPSPHPPPIRAKLTEADVRAMAELRGQGWFLREIAERFGVTRGAVRCVLNGRNWKHVERPLFAPGDGQIRGSRHELAKLAEDEIPEIFARRAAGASLAAIGREFGVSRQAIRLVLRRETWAHVDPQAALSPQT